MEIINKIFSASSWLSFLSRLLINVNFFLEKHRIDFTYRKKIKRILHSNSLIYQMRKEEIKKCKAFSKDKYGYNDALWHRAYYGFNGIWSLNYIPEHFFYNYLENYLNPDHAKLPYLDKNNYDRLFPNEKKPKTIIRKIGDEYYDENYKSCLIDDILKHKRYNKIIIKPTINASGGRGIAQLNFKDLEKFLNHEKRSNLIVQERIKQHKDLAKFNKSSVNTIRISTVKIKSVVKLCSAFLRIGRENSIVDNVTCGGHIVGVNQDGYLKEHAFKRILHLKNNKHLDSKVKFENFKIPSWTKLIKTALRLHDSVPGLGLLSWDMAIDETGEPVLIEVNISSQDINVHQFANGPLFGDMTEDVLDWYKKQKNPVN